MQSEKNKRAPRVHNFALNEVFFVPAGHSEKIPIINISASGLSLGSGKSNEYLLRQGNRIQGQISFGSEKFSAELDIVRIDRESTGCRVVSQNSEVERYLRQHFTTEMKAQKLTHVDDGILEKQEDGAPHWFFDGHACQLYYVEKNNQLLRYRLSYYEHEVHGASEKNPVYFSEEQPGNIPENVLKSLLSFVQHIEEVSGECRTQLVSDLSRLKV